MAKRKNSIIVQDLITIGVFNALLITLFFIVAFSIGIFAPIMAVMPIILALLGGSIFMLMIAKTTRPGAFLITGTVLGLTLFTMGPGGIMFYCIFTCGLIAEVVFNIIGREKFISKILGYSIFMTGLALGQYIPFLYLKEEYIDLYTSKGETGTVSILIKLSNAMNFRLVILLCLLTIAASVLSCFWGKKMLKKHFEKAGIV